MAVSQTTINAIELAANVTLAAIPYTAAFAPLAAAIEAGINPLIASIAAGNTKTTDELAAYGALIAGINILKQTNGLPADVIAKLNEYAVAAQNGLVAAMAAGVKGYDASQLQPVTLIS